MTATNPHGGSGPGAKDLAASTLARPNFSKGKRLTGRRKWGRRVSGKAQSFALLSVVDNCVALREDRDGNLVRGFC